MKTNAAILAAMLVVAFAWTDARPHGQAETLPAPGFHHLHLNSTNLDAAIAFYTKEIPRATMARMRADGVTLLPLYTTDEGGLNAPMPQGRRGAAAKPRTEANCKVPRGADKTWPALEVDGMYRAPSAGVTFGDVAMNWYVRQGDRPLVSTRGHLADHIALSVANLDAWVTKLRAEGVTFLEQAYTVGDARAVMIEGPSHEALELVEVK